MLVELEEGCPADDWAAWKEEYVRAHEVAGKRPRTVKALDDYLKGWVAWLTERNVSPSSQQLRKYLVSKDLTEPSYRQMGKAIVKFTNNYSEDGALISLIEPLGCRPEKPTVAMPAETVKVVVADIKEQVATFQPLAEKCTDPRDQVRLANYLGKEL